MVDIWWVVVGGGRFIVGSGRFIVGSGECC